MALFALAYRTNIITSSSTTRISPLSSYMTNTPPHNPLIHLPHAPGQDKWLRLDARLGYFGCGADWGGGGQSWLIPATISRHHRHRAGSFVRCLYAPPRNTHSFITFSIIFAATHIRSSNHSAGTLQISFPRRHG